jgi:hypothetical protein
MAKARCKIEYGDFQTPRELADAIVTFLRDAGTSPSVIVEPTCGIGSFILAATEGFPTVRQVFAYDINADYVSALRKELRDVKGVHCQVVQQDFFTFNWSEFFSAFRGEILVIGNPPWVTNAALGALESDNLPKKTNFQNRAGFAAKTGKANFDISEWMLIKLLEALNGQRGCVAMLCKTATARKVLRHVWINRFNIARATIHLIDSATYFRVSVDACLLILHMGITGSSPTAGVYSDLTFNHKVTTFGLMGRELVADVDEYNRLRDLDGLAYYTWRSGVKHDAVSVMEFKKEGSTFINGFGERVELERIYTYPLLKSSDLANGRLTPQRYVLVTQRTPKDDTDAISKNAPKTWAYLLRHADVLDRRRSIIYQKRPRFSVFGVGDYTFSPWKVAISGLYKNCRFEVVGLCQNKPVVLDDTCYFIPCSSEQEASFACLLLNSDLAKRFLHALVFYDAKRPVTIDVLNRIDLKRIAERLGLESAARKYFRDAAFFEGRQGLFVFEKQEKYRTLIRPPFVKRKTAPDRKLEK